MKKRVAIIGLGNIAQKVYLPILSRHTGIDIVGILGRRENLVTAIADQYRIQNKFTNLNELLKQNPDAIFVHTSTEAHAEIVIECLRAGVNVYVDKPLSYSLDESYKMVRVAEENKRLLCVGFNRRFAPMNIAAKLWMSDVGGVSNCIVQKNRAKLQDIPANQTIYDDLIHILDLIIWFGNNTSDLKSFNIKKDDKGRLISSCGSIELRNTSSFFSMDRSAGVDMEKLELHGNGRSVEVINLEVAKFYDQKTGECIKHFGSWDEILYRRGFIGIVNHFIESLDDFDHCTVTGEQVLSTHELAEKLCK